MKFDDSDKDYFLHDFDKENDPEDGKDQNSAPADSINSSGQGNDNRQTSPSFDFSNGNNGSVTAPVKPKRHRGSRVLIWFLVIVILVLGVTVAIRYFVPYITDSQITGYVTLVEKRGIIFHTFEGEMVSEAQLADTGRVYSRDIYFSIPDDSLARRLQQYQGTGTPVTVVCKKYYGTLPWRGASNTILVSFTPKDQSR